MKKQLLLCLFALICNVSFSQEQRKDSVDLQTLQIIPSDSIEIISNNEITELPAKLHFYRSGGVGALVGYDIRLNDDVICRTANNWKTTVDVYITGEHLIWAKTESKAEIPIEIKAGSEYYIRCGMKMGVVVGRPTLELVDPVTGEAELQSIKEKKTKKTKHTH